jgi:hypothetical protein
VCGAPLAIEKSGGRLFANFDEYWVERGANGRGPVQLHPHRRTAADGQKNAARFAQTTKSLTMLGDSSISVMLARPG